MQVEIKLKCIQCSNHSLRKYSWIDPAKYSKPDAAEMTSMFYCKACGKGNAVRLKFLPTGEISLVKDIDFKSMINEDVGFSYIGGPSGEEPIETLTEDGAISLLNDPIID